MYFQAPNTRLKIGVMGLIAKRKWKNKTQLSEVVEDTELNDDTEGTSPIKFI
jgi:hypothetical protein